MDGKFLGYSVTWDRAARLRVSPAAVKRLKTKLRGILRHGQADALPTLWPVARAADLCFITTNRPTQDWDVFLGDVPAATAIQDRFLAHATIVQMTGKSYRLRQRTSTVDHDEGYGR